MSGARALSKDEHLKLKESFASLRNKCLYILGKNTGFRISELLSITIGQVYKKDFVKVARKNVKGQSESREVILNKEAKEAISEYLNSLESLNMNGPLFVSRNGSGMKSLSRIMAHKVFKQAFEQAGLTGSLSTHSCRKSYAMKIYEASQHDLIMTSRALGHKRLATTINYLPVNQDKLNSIILEEDE